MSLFSQVMVAPTGAGSTVGPKAQPLMSTLVPLRCVAASLGGWHPPPAATDEPGASVGANAGGKTGALANMAHLRPGFSSCTTPRSCGSRSGHRRAWDEAAGPRTGADLTVVRER